MTILNFRLNIFNPFHTSNFHMHIQQIVIFFGSRLDSKYSVPAISLLFVCWCSAAYLDVLLPTVDQWNRVKPLAVKCTASLHKINSTGTFN